MIWLNHSTFHFEEYGSLMFNFKNKLQRTSWIERNQQGIMSKIGVSSKIELSPFSIHFFHLCQFILFPHQMSTNQPCITVKNQHQKEYYIIISNVPLPLPFLILGPLHFLSKKISFVIYMPFFCTNFKLKLDPISWNLCE